MRLRCAVDALAAVPPTTSTCQIPSLVDVTLEDESRIELRHRYPGLATDPLLGQLPAFLKNKNPSADENPSTGRDESEEDKGDALPVRRWRRARTFDGKQSPSPCAVPSRSSDAPRRRLLLASARSFVTARVARIDSGPQRSCLLSGPKCGEKARIGRFVFWAISNRTVILDLAWFETGLFDPGGSGHDPGSSGPKQTSPK